VNRTLKKADWSALKEVMLQTGSYYDRRAFSAARYNLDRTNVPLPDPHNPGFFLLSGKNRIRGFETELKGYVKDEWQSALGYAYTDARVASDTSTTIVKGNRTQLVPFSQFSWWN
jgi:catecholate siderophore receptor